MLWACLMLVMGHQLEGKEEATAVDSVLVCVYSRGENERSYRQGAYDLARGLVVAELLLLMMHPKQGEARVLPGHAQRSPPRPAQQHYHHT